MMILSYLFRDFLIIALALAPLSAILYGLVELKRRVSKLSDARIFPERITLRLVAGETRKIKTTLKSPIPLSIKKTPHWVNLAPRKLSRGADKVWLTISPIRSGIYKLDGLDVEVCDRLGFWIEDSNIRIDLNVTAYPRVFPWIVEALRIIGEGSRGGGDVPGRFKGVGFEYLWSRSYQPGDSLRQVDWKATARRVELMVKETLEDTYGSFKIIHDIRSHGEVTADESAASLLSAVISLTETGLPVDLVIKKGAEILVYRRNLKPVEALKIILSFVVNKYISPKWNIYELLEPKSASELRRLMASLGSLRLLGIIAGGEGGVSRRMWAQFLAGNGTGLLIYVGSILIDTEFVIELSEKARHKGLRMIVLTPERPWADAKGLDEAYMMYQSYHKVHKALERMGVEMLHRMQVAVKTLIVI